MDRCIVDPPAIAMQYSITPLVLIAVLSLLLYGCYTTSTIADASCPVADNGQVAFRNEYNGLAKAQSCAYDGMMLCPDHRYKLISRQHIQYTNSTDYYTRCVWSASIYL